MEQNGPQATLATVLKPAEPIWNVPTNTTAAMLSQRVASRLATDAPPFPTPLNQPSQSVNPNRRSSIISLSKLVSYMPKAAAAAAAAASSIHPQSSPVVTLTNFSPAHSNFIPSHPVYRDRLSNFCIDQAQQQQHQLFQTSHDHRLANSDSFSYCSNPMLKSSPSTSMSHKSSRSNPQTAQSIFYPCKRLRILCAYTFTTQP